MLVALAVAIGVAGGSSLAAAPSSKADLGVGISDSPDPVDVGGQLSYTVSVTNWGPNPARDVVVVTKPPLGFLASSATPSTGSCKISGRNVNCQLGTIGVGTAATVPTVVITGTATRPGRNVAAASVSSRTFDPVGGNNLATEATRVRAVHVPDCDGLPATIVGTTGPDRLVGTRGNDVVVGLGGDDVIRTFSGEDVICGGRGADRVRAGIWADHVFGGPGADRLSGDGGNDRIAGNGGADRLFGRRGADQLLGGAGFDFCRGGPGRNELHGCERRR